MPRTTVDMTRDNYSRLRSYSHRRQLPLNRALNALLARALDQQAGRAKRRKVPTIPSFHIGVKVDPADRDALYAAMERGA
jgi:hypothetical protein